ncbi:glycosyltransferase family 25 protein [Caenimonas sedimenti]|uniref:Glycosyltransferase family 25 protein n=1 Tax=Caenimonas sedimenti TaxID=2596921 RepID=A0A562ZPS2_9BURK|nr:glycosyltransferase family 25 protein [Caenimonas sedimenti]TWO70579.1 glycosyltransferase family 25 protein [Caenimonas sedimenti]
MHPIAGYYINLDRSPDRAAFMQEQLARLGLHGMQRHVAIDGAQSALPPGCTLLPGEYACFLSHLRVLEQAPPESVTLVLEDDVELSPHLPELLSGIVQAAAPAFDIALLECQPHFSLADVSRLWDVASRHFVGVTRRIGGVDLMDAQRHYKWGMIAYVVPPAARRRVLEVLHRAMANGPILPIDRCLEQAFTTQALRGAITVPFLATPSLRWHGRSTISNDRLPQNPLTVLRRLLYAGGFGDIEELTRSFAGAPADPALRLFGLVLRELAAYQRAVAQLPPQPPPAGDGS